MPGISAVIPTWNRGELLRAILQDLSVQTMRPSQIIVVDNGSTDETRSIATSSGAELVRFTENRGFAVAVNEGIRKSTGEWILILNNDVALPPNWLETLWKSAADEDAAFAVGKLVAYDDPALIDGSWDLLSRGAHAWRCGFRRPDGPHWSERREISFAPMTAALFHDRVFNIVGLLDERFEAYYEDVDFGLRCALAGLHGIYEPKAVAKHMGKKTLGKNSERVLFLTGRNQLFLLAKHFPPRTLRRWLWPVLVAQLLSLAGSVQSGQFLAGVRGIREGLRRWRELRGKQLDISTLETTLSRSEAEIRSLQRELGCDPYWRLYFSLVRSG